MISKKKICVGLAGVASMLLIAGSTFGAVGASASGPGAGACVVTGNVSITGGGGILTIARRNDTFTFSTLNIDCTSSDADDTGQWSIAASGSSTGLNDPTGENCGDASGGALGSGTGGGTITGTSSPNGAAGDGPVNGGAFSFTRQGSAVEVKGTINTAGFPLASPPVAAETHTFVATLVFTPVGGDCDPQSPFFGDLTTLHPTTAAGITGTAIVTE